MATTSAGIGLLVLSVWTRLVASAPFFPYHFTNATLSSQTPAAGTSPIRSLSSTNSLLPSTTSVGLPATVLPSPTSNGFVTVVTSSSTLLAATSSANWVSSTTYEPTTTTAAEVTIPSTTTAAVTSTPDIPIPDSTATPVPGTMRLSFVNNMEEDPVYVYLTGTDSTGQLVMLTQNGDFYYPTTSSATPEPIPESANVAMNLNGYGQTTQMTIPSYISSARLWVSHRQPLQFGITTGGLVEPSAVNDEDPNHNTNWGFVEFTYNCADDGGLYANLSFVDFIGLALGMTVSGSGNTTQSALGPHKAAKDEVCRRLKAQATVDGQPWDQLCKNDDTGKVIRVVSPQTLVTQNSSAFDTYFDAYVDAVWQQYVTTPLAIQTQSSSGTINCTTSGEVLLCDGDDTPFTKPSAGDIFGCSSGPFANTGNAVHLAAIPRVCAGLNRATMHLPGGNVQPQLPPSYYYAPPATNFYSRFVHDAEIDGKGYAFSYDDVSPDQAEYNTAGVIVEPSPEEMTIYVGGYRESRS